MGETWRKGMPPQIEGQSFEVKQRCGRVTGHWYTTQWVENAQWRTPTNTKLYGKEVRLCRFNQFIGEWQPLTLINRWRLAASRNAERKDTP